MAVAVGLLLVAWCLREDVQPDLYFHLAAGRWMLANGLPSGGGEFLDTPFPEHPFTNHEWLFQVIAWPLFALGGAGLLTLIKSLTVGATFAVMAAATRRHGTQLRWVALAAALMVGGGRFILRPEVFSFLGVALHLHLLTAERERVSKRTLILLPLLQVVWSNTHGFSLLGPVLVIGTLGAGILHRGIAWRAGDGEERRLAGALARLLGPAPGDPRLRGLALLLVLELLGSCFNPYGLEAALYPWLILQRAGQDTASAGLSYRVVELASPFERRVRGVPEIQLYLAWLAVAPVLFGVALARGRARLEEGVLALLMAGTSFLYLRNLPFAALGLLLPTVAGLGAIADWLRARRPRVFPRLRLASGVVCVLVVLGTTRAVLNDSFHRNATYDARPGVGLGAFPTYSEAVAFLAQAPPAGGLFNNFGAGHYLIYAREGARPKPSICGNTDLYPRSYLRTYHQIMRGERSLIAELERQGISDVLLDHRVEVEDRVLAELITSPAWVLVHVDPHAVVFRKAPAGVAAVDPAALARQVLDTWEFVDEEPDRFAPTRALRALKLLPRRSVQPITRLNTARLLQLLGQVDAAKELTRRAQVLAPDSALVLMIQGGLHQYDGDASLAARCFERLTELTPNDPLPWVKLGLLARQRGELRASVRHFERASAIDPGSRLALVNLLTVLELKRDPVELRRVLHRAGETVSASRRSYYLAVSAMLEGEYARAEGSLEEAVGADSRFVPALQRLAEVQHRRGKLAEAEESRERVTRLIPDNAAAWHELGRVRLARKREVEALEAWRRARAANPREIVSLLSAAELHIRRKEREQAARLMAEARKRAPGDPRVIKLSQLVTSMDRD